MTVKEKREALIRYCNDGHGCDKCPLHSKKVCRCRYGYGLGFEITDHAHHSYITDAEVIGAYELVFGNDETNYLRKKIADMESNNNAKEGSIMITSDDLIHAQAEAITHLMMENPTLMLITKELSATAALTAKILFKEGK